MKFRVAKISKIPFAWNQFLRLISKILPFDRVSTFDILFLYWRWLNCQWKTDWLYGPNQYLSSAWKACDPKAFPSWLWLFVKSESKQSESARRFFRSKVEIKKSCDVIDPWHHNISTDMVKGGSIFETNSFLFEKDKKLISQSKVLFHC